MDRDPKFSSETFVQQRTASDPTIWADYFNLGRGVESNTGNCSGMGDLAGDKAITAPVGAVVLILRASHVKTR
jgi:hypothetical protein